jgi:hypothetical protein
MFAYGLMKRLFWNRKCPLRIEFNTSDAVEGLDLEWAARLSGGLFWVADGVYIDCGGGACV